jgi:hypothetical protein
LSNTVYIGKPSFCGEVVPDQSLGCVDEARFSKAQAILAEIGSEHEMKADAVFQQVVSEDLESLSDLLGILCHINCGGRVEPNGTRKDSVPKQIGMHCIKCGKAWRFPWKRRKLGSEDISMFDTPNAADVSGVRRLTKKRVKQGKNSPRKETMDSFF